MKWPRESAKNTNIKALSLVLRLFAAILTQPLGEFRPAQVQVKSRLVKVGQGWSRLVKVGQGWSRLVKVGQGWSGLVRVGQSLANRYGVLKF